MPPPLKAGLKKGNNPGDSQSPNSRVHCAAGVETAFLSQAPAPGAESCQEIPFLGSSSSLVHKVVGEPFPLAFSNAKRTNGLK